MLLSATAEIVLAASAVLASLEDDELLSAGALAAACGSTPFYLSKVLARMSDAGLLEGERGRKGGYRLARDPRNIKLVELVELFTQAPQPMRSHHPFCSNCAHPCSLDGQVSLACQLINKALSQISLAQYSADCPNVPGALANARHFMAAGVSPRRKRRSPAQTN